MKKKRKMEFFKTNFFALNKSTKSFRDFKKKKNLTIMNNICEQQLSK